MNKKFGFLAILALLVASTQAFAAQTIRLNRGGEYLRECGGYIQATTSGAGNSWGSQINIVLRDVKNCSNFYIATTGRVYKLQGSPRDMGGSFTIPKAAVEFGFNRIRLIVRSNSGAHKDVVDVKFFSF